jgi:hypothetical protein
LLIANINGESGDREFYVTAVFTPEGDLYDEDIEDLVGEFEKLTDGSYNAQPPRSNFHTLIIGSRSNIYRMYNLFRIQKKIVMEIRYTIYAPNAFISSTQTQSLTDSLIAAAKKDANRLISRLENLLAAFE